MLCTGKSFTNFSLCKTQDFFFWLVLFTLYTVCFSVICTSYLFILKCSSRCASQDLTGKIVLPRKSLLNLNDNINYYTDLVNATGKIMSIEDTVCQLYTCKHLTDFGIFSLSLSGHKTTDIRVCGPTIGSNCQRHFLVHLSPKTLQKVGSCLLSLIKLIIGVP